jgi:hypothetical protein
VAVAAPVGSADVGGLKAGDLAPAQAGEGHEQDPDELRLVAEQRAPLSEQERGVLTGPDLLGAASGAVLVGFSPAAALPGGGIDRDMTGDQRVSQDRVQPAPGAADVLGGVAALLDQVPFPAIDLPAGDRPEWARAERGQDEAADRGGVVGPGGELDIPARPDLVKPLAESQIGLLGLGCRVGNGGGWWADLDCCARVPGRLQGPVLGRVPVCGFAGPLGSIRSSRTPSGRSGRRIVLFPMSRLP